MTLPLVSDQPPALGAEAVIAVLNAHGVAYVVVDAFAVQAFGALVPSMLDIDLTPASMEQNEWTPAPTSHAAIAVYTAARSV